ncbi:hypothetical protein BGX31_000441 [Mortierella sp. GBA43]|nr:hypothetical protein BGX31_000441 [Mortierella sp. GBA43]
MNFHQHQDTHQLPLIKQEGQSDQDTIQTFQDTIHSFQNYQSIPTYPSPQQQQQQQQQPQTYAFQGSTQGNLNSFPAAVPQNQYSLNSHLMGLSMQTAASGAGPASSSLAPLPNNGLMSGVNSGSTTPAMAYASAPSSPILSALQQQFPSGQNAQYNHSSNFYQSPSPQQQQQQQPHPNRYSYQGPHSTQSMSTSSLTSSFYPTSPPQQHQQQHGSTSTSFNAIPPAQVRQQQYPPLVPPLTPAQHAQYHLLLGSALSSAASTPYHSNQSTPYSSMPASPTLDHQQLGDPNLVQKPKRRQVKNACVNCQKACKKCDEGRPCARCIKYGLTETCVDSTRKVRKKGIKRGPYKRKIPPSALGSASASTTPILSHAILATTASGYMSEPVTALNSPTQSHMLPFTSSSSAMGFGYNNNSGSAANYTFQTQTMDHGSSSSNNNNNNHSNYAPAYTTSYSSNSLYSTPYGMNDGTSMTSSNLNPNSNPSSMYNSTLHSNMP